MDKRHGKKFGKEDISSTVSFVHPPIPPKVSLHNLLHFYSLFGTSCSIVSKLRRGPRKIVPAIGFSRNAITHCEKDKSQTLKGKQEFWEKRTQNSSIY
jgi:hypothetical protein